MAAAILVKPTNIVALPAFLLYLPILAWVRKKSVLRIESAVEAALLVAPVVASVMVVGWLNWLRFDSVFISGYPGRMFGMPLGVGLYGLLFSVNKGLLFHAPLVLLAPVGLLIMRRDERADAALVTVTFLAYIALSANTTTGVAGGSGARVICCLCFPCCSCLSRKLPTASPSHAAAQSFWPWRAWRSIASE